MYAKQNIKNVQMILLEELVFLPLVLDNALLVDQSTVKWKYRLVMNDDVLDQVVDVRLILDLILALRNRHQSRTETDRQV